MELGDLGLKKQKVPRRTIYFASGETMEEYSTDEEEEEPEKNDVVATVDPVSPGCLRLLLLQPHCSLLMEAVFFFYYYSPHSHGVHMYGSKCGEWLPQLFQVDLNCN